MWPGLTKGRPVAKSPRNAQKCLQTFYPRVKAIWSRFQGVCSLKKFQLINWPGLNKGWHVAQLCQNVQKGLWTFFPQREKRWNRFHGVCSNKKVHLIMWPRLTKIVPKRLERPANAFYPRAFTLWEKRLLAVLSVSGQFCYMPLFGEPKSNYELLKTSRNAQRDLQNRLQPFQGNSSPNGGMLKDRAERPEKRFSPE